MKKEILVGLLAIGFIFAGVLSASAATWTLIQDSSYAGTSPASRTPHNLLCVSGVGSGAKCNMDNAVDCINTGNPSTGVCSYAELSFTMASSCAAGPTGQPCTQNTDCGSPLSPCVPCNPPARVGLSYFGQHPGGGAKSAGTYSTLSCNNQGDVTALAIGTSEVVSNVGGSCMTLSAFNSATGCASGAASLDYDVTLWTNSVYPNCNTNAGRMPGLTLAGSIMAATAPVTACGYTTSELTNIAGTVGLGAGDYMSVMCGSGTLPTDLATVCIPGAAWEAVIVASTATNLASTCPAACPTGCTGAAAEGVE